MGHLLEVCEGSKCILTLKNEKQRHILCDPQTSGGLLIAVKKEAAQKWNQF
jgi:selenophosphate synthase